MWWLTFRHGEVVIVEASSLVHARTVAAQFGLGRASHFAQGHFIDPDRAALIPGDFIGRMLMPLEARQVRDLLESRSRIEPAKVHGPSRRHAGRLSDRVQYERDGAKAKMPTTVAQAHFPAGA